MEYKGKLNNIKKFIMVLVITICIMTLNTLGIIGFLPGIILIVYLFGMNTKDKILFKLLNILILILWVIHDFTIKCYIGVICEILSIIGCISVIISYKKVKNIDVKN